MHPLNRIATVKSASRQEIKHAVHAIAEALSRLLINCGRRGEVAVEVAVLTWVSIMLE
jgi:hypothetical protein